MQTLQDKFQYTILHVWQYSTIILFNTGGNAIPLLALLLPTVKATGQAQ